MTDAGNRKARWFRWGLLLAWVPCLPLIFGLADTFRGISTQRATGVAAVAGGFTEFYATLGMACFGAFQISAIILLGKTFSQGSGLRVAFSLLTMAWCTVMLTFFGLSVWLIFWRIH